jgi:adenine-specific DNA-methyltransferase
MIEDATRPEVPPSAFRPIHYLGNKLRMVDTIDRVVASCAQGAGPVCDLFSGTGVVAHRLAANRRVVAADIQEYSCVLTAALLNPQALSGLDRSDLRRDARAHENLIRSTKYYGLIELETDALRSAVAGAPDMLCRIVEHGSVLRYAIEHGEIAQPLGNLLHSAAASVPSGADTVLSRYYGGLYFSYSQAAELDGLAYAIRKLRGPSRTVALAALLSTASDLVSTVGSQFAQPVRPTDKDGRPKVASLRVVAKKRVRSAADVYWERLQQYEQLTPTSEQHTVLRADYRDVLRQLPADTAAVYADPPYTRDHYSRFYHVLETIAQGDEPSVSSVRVGKVDRASRALYRRQRHQSPFCIASEVVPAFTELFSGVARLGAPLVLSYSPYTTGTVARPRPRLVTVDQIIELAQAHFAHVDVQSAGQMSHSKLNQDHLNREVTHAAEVLIIGRSSH